MVARKGGKKKGDPTPQQVEERRVKRRESNNRSAKKSAAKKATQRAELQQEDARLKAEQTWLRKQLTQDAQQQYVLQLMVNQAQQALGTLEEEHAALSQALLEDYLKLQQMQVHMAIAPVGWLPQTPPQLHDHTKLRAASMTDDELINPLMFDDMDERDGTTIAYH